MKNTFAFGFWVGVASSCLGFLLMLIFADPFKPHDTASQKALILQDKLTVVVGTDPETEIWYCIGEGSGDNLTRRVIGFNKKENADECKKKIVAAIDEQLGTSLLKANNGNKKEIH